MNETTAALSQDLESRELDRLRDREEILQICYWFEGEGFGRQFTPDVLMPFLNFNSQHIENTLNDLEKRGQLQRTGDGYRFSAEGRREAGRLFADAFADFQRPAHGECEDGCCEEDDHSRCGDDCPYS